MIQIKAVTICLITIYIIGVIHTSYALESCNCVAFRVDDIQDYWLNNVQTGIMDEFEKKNASLTIGIIGNYFGQDKKLVQFIDSRINSSPKLEIASHGWNHENFKKFTESEQSNLLRLSVDKIFNVTEERVQGFIPPYDSINNNTLVASKENNMTYISTNETSDRPPYKLSNSSLYILPETAEVGSVNKQQTDWIEYSFEQTYAQVLRSVAKYGYAIIVIHPQDVAQHDGINFSNEINQTSMHRIELLVDKVREQGYKIVTIEQIPENVKYNQSYPLWVNNIFNWYYSHSISETEEIHAVNYLIENQIIVLK